MVNIYLFMAVRAELVLSMWNPSGLGFEPKSPAPPRKSPSIYFIFSCHFVVSVAIWLTKFFTFLGINPCWYVIFKFFLPFHRLSFQFVNCFFCPAEAFESDVVHDGNSGSSDWGNVLRMRRGLSRYVSDKKPSKNVVSTDHIWSRESSGAKIVSPS